MITKLRCSLIEFHVQFTTCWETEKQMKCNDKALTVDKITLGAFTNFPVILKGLEVAKHGMPSIYCRGMVKLRHSWPIKSLGNDTPARATYMWKKLQVLWPYMSIALRVVPFDRNTLNFITHKKQSGDIFPPPCENNSHRKSLPPDSWIRTLKEENCLLGRVPKTISAKKNPTR